MSGKVNSAILISMDAGEFFEEIRKVVREEVKLATREREIPRLPRSTLRDPSIIPSMTSRRFAICLAMSVGPPYMSG